MRAEGRIICTQFRIYGLISQYIQWLDPTVLPLTIFVMLFQLSKARLIVGKLMGLSCTEKLSRDNQVNLLQWHSASRRGRSAFVKIFCKYLWNTLSPAVRQKWSMPQFLVFSLKSLIKFHFFLKGKNTNHLHWLVLR